MAVENNIRINCNNQLSDKNIGYIGYLFEKYSNIINDTLVNLKTTNNLQRILILNYAQVHDKSENKYTWFSSQLTNIIYQIIIGFSIEEKDGKITQSEMHDAWVLSKLMKIKEEEDGAFKLETVNVKEDDKDVVSFTIENTKVNSFEVVQSISIEKNILKYLEYYKDLQVNDQNKSLYSYNVFVALSKNLKAHFINMIK